MKSECGGLGDDQVVAMSKRPGKLGLGGFRRCIAESFQRGEFGVKDTFCKHENRLSVVESICIGKLQCLPVMDTAINDFKLQLFVDMLRKTTVDPGIRGHLDTSLATR